MSELQRLKDMQSVREKLQDIWMRSRRILGPLGRATSDSIKQIELQAAEARQIIRNYLPASGRFVVHERFNGFELEDTKTGAYHWLSDGVDCVPDPDGPDEAFLPPGGELFCMLWAEQFNADEAETLEAYFPEMVRELTPRMINFLKNVKNRIEFSNENKEATLEDAIELSGELSWSSLYQMSLLETDKPGEYGVTAGHAFVSEMHKILDGYPGGTETTIEDYMQELNVPI